MTIPGECAGHISTHGISDAPDVRRFIICMLIASGRLLASDVRGVSLYLGPISRDCAVIVIDVQLIRCVFTCCAAKESVAPAIRKLK